jgi:hypothetical protein
MMSDELKPNRKYGHLYAIVRYESDASPNTPIDFRVTIKKVVEDAAYAQQEVERLNQLNKGKGCCYFFQATRFESHPVSSPSMPAILADDVNSPIAIQN